MKKKLFVVSDIHGCATLFKLSLKSSGFENANKEHLLVCLGDCFDRGYENVAVYDYLQSISNKVLVKGNHEDLLESVIADHELSYVDYHNGTDITVREFFGNKKVRLDGTILRARFIEKKLLNFTSNMLNYFETKSYIFTHGWIPVLDNPDFNSIDDPFFIFNENWRHARENEWKDARFMPWYKMYQEGLVDKEKTIVCGHASAAFAATFDRTRRGNDTNPYYGDHVIAIDANGYRSGRLNIVVLEDELLEE